MFNNLSSASNKYVYIFLADLCKRKTKELDQYLKLGEIKLTKYCTSVPKMTDFRVFKPNLLI